MAEQAADHANETYVNLKNKLHNYSGDENMIFYVVAAILGAVGLLICALVKCMSASKE